jgi:hypothetical protein
MSDLAEPRRSAPIAVGEAFEPNPDAVAQWLDWEAQANLRGFRISTAPVQVDVVAVPCSDVEVHVLPGAPREVLDLFLRGDRVMIPRHPLNRDPTAACGMAIVLWRKRQLYHVEYVPSSGRCLDFARLRRGTPSAARARC